MTSDSTDSSTKITPVQGVEVSSSLDESTAALVKPQSQTGFRPVQSALGLGVFILLSGGIWLTVKHLGSAFILSMDHGEMEHGDIGGMDHSNMSHDEMMTVDGAFNALPVQVEIVRPGLMQEAVTYTGSVYPYLEVTVYPRIAGQLRDYGIYPGDRVQKGQLLAQLDALERRTELAEARAERDVMEEVLDANTLQLTEQKREIERLEAELDYMQLKAKRYKDLVAGGALAQNDYDVVASEVSAKQSTISGAKAKLSRMQAELKRDEAMISQSLAKESTAAVMARYTDITAPISGIVQARMADPGVVVQPGMGILKLGDYSRVRLRANVSQADAMGISKDSTVEVAIPGSEIGSIRGKITSIFPNADPQTRTVMVEAVVDNPKDQLLSGQFLEMKIIKSSQPTTLSVPQKTIHQYQGQSAVWVTNGTGEFATAERRVVQRGIVSGDRVAITKGLKSGDRLITSGFSRIRDGVKVSVVDGDGVPVASLSSPQEGSVVIDLVSPNAKDVKAGTVELTLQVRDESSKDPIAVEDLSVDVTMPMKNMAPMTTLVDLTVLPEPGKYRVKTHFGMKGDWIVKAQVKDKKHQGRAQFTLNAK